MMLRCERLEEIGRERIDTLVIPGATDEHLRSALGNEALMRSLKPIASNAQRICSVCSGAFFLAEMGILARRRATTHWLEVGRLSKHERVYEVDPKAVFIEAGKVWTSAGVTSGADMALAIVERDLGSKTALAVARRLLVFVVRPGGQPQFSGPLDVQTRAHGTEMHDLPSWIESNLSKPLTVAMMAEGMKMSVRTFHRRCVAVFDQTPLGLLQSLRIELAKSLLVETVLPLKTIVSRCGFSNMSAFRRQFVQSIEVTPTAYRERFSRPRH
jgi:transcriptional regulator GlxA family with amidase domain